MASRFLAPFSGRGLTARDPFLDLHREINRLFEDPFRGIATRPAAVAALSPSIDVDETDEGWTITAELPGVDEKDIDLRLDGDMLTISGEKRSEKKDEERRFVERSYGSFTRSIQLPFTPDQDKVEADCEKGVLTIKLPKGAEQERSKRIAIGSAGQKTIEAGAKKEEPAFGKDWGKEKASTEEEKAEKGQGAPA